MNLREQQECCETHWLMQLRLKECPENIIEMIVSKLDENNHEETEIKELWKETEINIFCQQSLQNEIVLINKLNNIISKLNNRDSKYYDLSLINYFEYNLIL